MNSKAIIIILAFVFGAGLSYLVLSRQQPGQPIVNRSELRSIMSRYDDVNFDDCQDLPAVQQIGCVDQALLADASAKQDAALCDRMPIEQGKSLCRELIDRQVKLGEAARVYCQGIQADTLCLDLAQTLIAVDKRTPELCADIVIDPVRGLCQSLIGPVAITAPANGGNQSEPPRFLRFGYTCTNEKEICDRERATWVKAVSTNNPAGCSQVANAELCRYEVALHIAFSANDKSLCRNVSATTAEPQDAVRFRCEFDYVAAKALQAGSIDGCSQVREDLVPLCQQFVQTAAEKRFDYLTK